MLRHLTKLLVAATLCVSAPALADDPRAGARTGTPSAAKSAPDHADELFEQATAAYDAGRLPEAHAKLLQAWALKKTHDIAGNLGVVELKLGENAQAAEHLTWALQHFPPTEADQAKHGFEQKLAKARAQIGALRVRVSVDGAEVTVNGRAMGRAPLDDEVFVEAGAVRVSARREGYATVEQTVSVAKGEAREVVIPLVAAKPAGRSVVPGVVLGSAAGAALITGVGLFAAGRSKLSSAHDAYDAIRNAGHSCVAGAANADPGCADLQSTASASNTLQRAGVGLLIGAGALGVGSVIYFMLPPSSASTRTGALRVTPALSPANAGLVLSGTF